MIVFLHGLIMLMNKTKSFLNVFYRFQPCERMRKHAFAGRNTQHICYDYKCKLKYLNKVYLVTQRNKAWKENV